MLSRAMYGFSPLLRLQDDMNRLFESFFEDTPAGRLYSQAYPALNLWEDGDAAHVEAELPGLSMGDVEVYVAGNELTISGERKIETQGEASWHRRERAQGRFSRTVTLPWDIQAGKVQATLRDGVLSVTLPKAETARPKKVKILTAS